MKTKYLRLLPLGALSAGLAACSAPPPPPTFAPLDYSYLPPMALNVANLNVVNNYVPSPDQATLIGEDPAPPGATLLAMLQHRLVPTGTPGTGTVTIQVASLGEANGLTSGTMTVDVSLVSADGRSTGFTEASVSASQPEPQSTASPADMQTALYALTKQLMDAMNVQLQYQIQHSLPSWISYTAAPGAAAAPAAGGVSAGTIQATPLTAPGGAVAAPAAPATGTAPTPGMLSLPPGQQP